METVNLFTLASRQAEWLSVRQAAVAGNIANVNTPGYRAVDVEPFANLVDKGKVSMTATNPSHLGGNVEKTSFKTHEDDRTTAALPSGNSVVLEQELMKAGETARTYELNTAVVKAFHRMMLMSVKG